jgi:K+-transporting ATPase ATPase C chain
MLRRQLVTGLVMIVALTVLTGFTYPLVMTGVAQVAFHDRANGSLVKRDGKVVGSALIGQRFTDAKGNPLPQYFQPRPSAAGESGYDGLASGGSNLGPANTVLLDAVAKRVDEYRRLNGLASNVAVPVDAVTASASGLDPDISVANADLQARRIADTRKVSLPTVQDLIGKRTNARQLGVLGEKTVNVLDLNLALDRLG